MITDISVNFDIETALLFHFLLPLVMDELNSLQMENSHTQKRCVNLDWLEIHAREPVGQPHNADYFRNQGCEVQEREYGTRVYREMFVIYG